MGMDVVFELGREAVNMLQAEVYEVGMTYRRRFFSILKRKRGALEMTCGFEVERVILRARYGVYFPPPILGWLTQVSPKIVSTIRPRFFAPL